MDQNSLEDLSKILIQLEKKQDQTDETINRLTDEWGNNPKTVYVTSAVPLSNEDKEELLKVLESFYHKTFTIENIVDKKILGGLKIRIGSVVIDNTLLSQLEKIKNSLISLN